MSKTNEELYKEPVDNYLEHSQHIIYDIHCSECYNNPPEVVVDDDGDIVLDDGENEEENMFGVDLEMCYNSYH